MTQTDSRSPIRARAAPPTWMGIPRRRVLLGLAIGIPSSVAFLLLASRQLDGGRIWSSVLDASPVKLVAAAVAFLVVYWLQAERWRRIARHEGSAPTRDFFAWVVGAVAVNNVVPGRPGELVRGYWHSRRVGQPLVRSLATVMVDRTFDVVALLVLLVVSLPAVSHPVWLRNVIAGSAIVIGLAAITLGVLIGYRRRETFDDADRPEGRWSRLHRQLLSFIDAIGAIFRKPSELLPVAGLGLLAWLAWSGAAWLVADALGIRLSVAEVLFAASVINLGVSIPSSPGFVGTFQWLTTSVLGGFGVEQNDAFTYSILLHACWYVPTTLGGIVLAVRAGTGALRRRPDAVAGEA